MPADTEDESSHRVRRVRIDEKRAITVARSGEYLGLSSDGAYLLCRPRGWTHSEGNVVEIVRIDGARLIRLAAESGPAPRWGAAGPAALVQVRSGEQGDEIWSIPACPFCYHLIW